MSAPPPDKPCASCGRPFSWRAKWAKNWESVRYCSQACRRRKVNQTDQAAERAILELLARRRPGASICPSEAARQLSPEGWRADMETVRRAARRLVNQGRLLVTQKGKVVDPGRVKGPIRLKLP